jgi:uncharacterized protein (DUF1786 family)
LAAKRGTGVRILAIDIGTGTQDILLFDSADAIENSVKLVAPSPTMRVAGRIRAATESRRPIVLVGVTMGGGPSTWALRQHLEAGLAVYATPDAARTFDDDLEVVTRWGVRIVGEDEAARVEGAARIELRDLDLAALRSAFVALGIDPRVDGLALACLDHGAAPSGYSDRLFRFEHVRRVVLERNDLLAFAYRPAEIPAYLTRARALLQSAGSDLPSVFLDTAPAAALGALQDLVVAAAERQVVINVGNSHSLAFHLRGTSIYGFFEHHTELLAREDVESLTERLVAGSLTQTEVFDGNGHGVFYAAPSPSSDMPTVAVTGPQRRMLAGSRLRPHFATPHGDMMLSGCFGLLRAFAAKYPSFAAEIQTALAE